jgi:hypothetical protein
MSLYPCGYNMATILSVMIVRKANIKKAFQVKKHAMNMLPIRLALPSQCTDKIVFERIITWLFQVFLGYL